MASGSSRTLVVNFIGNSAQLEQAMKRIGVQANQMQAVGKKFEGVGRSLTRYVTLPIIAVGAASAKMAMDFEASTERLHTQAGVAQKAVEGLRKGILNMAGSVGETPQALSEGMYHIASSMNAVLPPTHRAQQELKILKVAAEGAQIGGTNLGDTSYALASAMNALHQNAGKAQQTMGKLNAIVGAGDMTMGDLLDALKSGIIPTARTFGISLQSVGAALAVFGDMGIRGAMAGTRLRMAITLLGAPSKAAAKYLDAIGMSSSQATAATQRMQDLLSKAGLRITTLADDLKKPDGLAVALQDLQDHLKKSGLSADASAALIARAFGGARVGAAIQSIAQNTDRVRLKFAQIGRDGSKFGQDWKATTHTAAFQWHAMVAQLQADAIKIGNDVLPIVLKALHPITSAVDTVVKAFERLPSGMQQTIIKGGILVAAIGPAMKLLGVFTSGIGRLWEIAQIAAKLATTGSFSAAMGKGGGAGGSAARGALNGAATAAESGAAGGVASRISSLGARALGFAGIAGFAAALIAPLTPVLNKWMDNNAEAEGRRFADKFLAPLPASISKHFREPLAQAATDAQGIIDRDQRARLAQQNAVQLRAGRGGAPRVSASVTATQNQQEASQRFNDFFNQGFQAGRAVVAGLHSVKDPTQEVLIQDFMGRLKMLPAQARPEAAKVMLTYAESLAANGKLPRKSVDSMIATIEQAFPQLGAFFKRQGLQSDQGFASALKFTAASNQLKKTLLGFRNQFGDWSISTNLTEQNINTNTKRAMDHLHDIVQSTTGQTRKDAIAELKKLQASVNSTFDAMVSKVSSAMPNFEKLTGKGFSRAANIVGQNMSDFEKSVRTAMASGILSASDGANKIAAALNAELKAFGTKPIPIATLKATEPKSMPVFVGGGHGGNFAQGGMVQFGQAGARGGDNIPVNFGGQHIMVGSGEQGYVLTGRQQRVANALMAPIGGLPGLFSNVDTPHYMAKGGPVGGSALTRMISTANAIDSRHYPYVWGGGHNPNFSPPYDCSGAVSAILHAGGLLSAPEVSGQLASYGLPGPGAVTIYANPVHTYMALAGRFFGTSNSNPGGGAGWFDGSARPGFAVRHAPLGPGGGDLSMIATPQVGGGGTMRTLAQKAVGKMAAAANRKLQNALMSVIGGGQFGGGQWGEFAGQGGTNKQNEALGHQMMLKIWGQGQWPFLDKLWTRESGWSSTARNPSSGAAGIPQDISGNMHGGAAGQIAWGLNYIKGRYGSPAAAWAHELSAGWYDKGGVVPYAGKFHDGGVVPGSPSQESLALVRGGEVVTPAAKGFSLSGLLRRYAHYTPKRYQHYAYQHYAGFPGGIGPQQLAGLANIPSQSLPSQIQGAQLGNAANQVQAVLAAAASAISVAQTSGNADALQLAQQQQSTAADQARGIYSAQLKADNSLLNADQAKLAKVNKALGKKGLTRKQRAALLQDKLALIQEIGTVQGDISSTQQSLTDLGNLNSGQDPNQSLIDALNAQAQAMTALKTSLDQQTVYMKSVGEIEKRQAIAAFADVISGQIGGNYLSRASGSAGDGSVARYGSAVRA